MKLCDQSASDALKCPKAVEWEAKKRKNCLELQFPASFAPGPSDVCGFTWLIRLSSVGLVVKLLHHSSVKQTCKPSQFAEKQTKTAESCCLTFTSLMSDTIHVFRVCKISDADSDSISPIEVASSMAFNQCHAGLLHWQEAEQELTAIAPAATAEFRPTAAPGSCISDSCPL